MIHIKVRTNGSMLTIEAKKMTTAVQTAVIATLYKQAADKLNMPFSRLVDDCIKSLEAERRIKSERIQNAH
jgi:hypothetical protein